MKTLLLTALTLGLLLGTAQAAKVATNEMILPDDRLDEVELLEGFFSPNDLLKGTGLYDVRVETPRDLKNKRPHKTRFYRLEGYTGPVGHRAPVRLYVWCKAEKVYVAVKLTDRQRQKLGKVRVVGRD